MGPDHPQISIKHLHFLIWTPYLFILDSPITIGGTRMTLSLPPHYIYSSLTLDPRTLSHPILHLAPPLLLSPLFLGIFLNPNFHPTRCLHLPDRSNQHSRPHLPSSISSSIHPTISSPASPVWSSPCSSLPSFLPHLAASLLMSESLAPERESSAPELLQPMALVFGLPNALLPPLPRPQRPCCR